MRMFWNPVKPVFLAVLIVLGIGAQISRAQAQETAVFAGGCFWCVEADFEKVPGVSEVVSGFSGGTVADPTYKQVVRGGTGHYEAVEITYDPNVVSYQELLFMFLRSIDPLDAGGQFCDRGQSYATAIFVSNEAEKRSALAAIRRASADLGARVVTPVLDRGAFYPAEEYHQDYYKQSDIVLTRRGPKTKASAYKFYRNACGRDDRVRELWGNAAPFTG